MDQLASKFDLSFGKVVGSVLQVHVDNKYEEKRFDLCKETANWRCQLISMAREEYIDVEASFSKRWTKPCVDPYFLPPSNVNT